MADKILSVVVPSYNMEAYLPKCLGSLIVDDKALLQKLEVIVVNDGSKDRTSEIAHEFEAKYPGVFRVIDKPNGHYGSCINAALPIAKGTYVKVLDADDYVYTDGFKQLLQVIDEECNKTGQSADLIVAEYATVSPDGSEIRRSAFCEDKEIGTLDDCLNLESRFPIHSICYKTEIPLKMGYRQLEGRPYTDTEWIIDPMTGVEVVRFVPCVVTAYLVGRDGQTMEAAVFARSFQHILDITFELVKRFAQYKNNCKQMALAYYRKQIDFMVDVSYHGGLLGYNGIKAQCDIEEFDKKLAGYPEFYVKAGALTFGPNHVPFYYVKSWRQYGKGLRWYFRYYLGSLLLWLATTMQYSKWRL